MFIRLRYAHLFLITIVLFFNLATFGMHDPFCAEEKGIFLFAANYAIKEIGLARFLKKLERTRKDKESFDVTLNFYIANTDDDLTNLIIETVTARELLYGYRPNSLKKHKDNLAFTSKANNYLGAYTRYWHRIDENGPHIRCTSTFTNIEILKELIAQIEKNNGYIQNTSII